MVPELFAPTRAPGPTRRPAARSRARTGSETVYVESHAPLRIRRAVSKRNSLSHSSLSTAGENGSRNTASNWTSGSRAASVDRASPMQSRNDPFPIGTPSGEDARAGSVSASESAPRTVACQRSASTSRANARPSTTARTTSTSRSSDVARRRTFVPPVASTAASAAARFQPRPVPISRRSIAARSRARSVSRQATA